MRRIASSLLLATSLFAADNPWSKVQDLKSGAELRIYKKGVSQPVEARFDDAGDERIVIVLKNRQSSIAKEDIDRIDARPAAKKTARKLGVDSTVKTTDPDFTPHPNPGVPAPGTVSSSSVSFGGSKPDFETVYQRAGTAEKK
jgi:hypothetical protein